MFLLAIPRYFDRLGTLLLAPMEALRRAARGEWNAVRDAAILIALAAVAIYTVDFMRVVVVGWDLGLREAVNELSWSLGRRLSPDLVLLFGVVVVVVAPLRITGRLSFDRSLSLAAASWMPAFLVRLAGATARWHLGQRPAPLLQGPEWWIALPWCAMLVILALTMGLRWTDE